MLLFREYRGRDLTVVLGTIDWTKGVLLCSELSSTVD